MGGQRTKKNGRSERRKQWGGLVVCRGTVSYPHRRLTVDKDCVESHLIGYQCKQANCTMTIDNSYKHLKSLPEWANRDPIVLASTFQRLNCTAPHLFLWIRAAKCGRRCCFYTNSWMCMKRPETWDSLGNGSKWAEVLMFSLKFFYNYTCEVLKTMFGDGLVQT